jgi:hypothetical protein
VDVGTDDSFGRDAAFTLLRRSETALAQDVDRLLFVSVCFD